MSFYHTVASLFWSIKLLNKENYKKVIKNSMICWQKRSFSILEKIVAGTYLAPCIWLLLILCLLSIHILFPMLFVQMTDVTSSKKKFFYLTTFCRFLTTFLMVMMFLCCLLSFCAQYKMLMPFQG